MPSWKKVLISGSDAALRSLIVTNGLTGSLLGTSSWAVNSQTASFVTASNVYGPFGSNSTISASFAVSSSRAVTSSFALTSSYASNGGVTQLLAGPNITLSPTNGLGQVTISSTSGGGGFNTATGSYGSFYDTTTQTNPVANTPRSMSLNTTDITNGVSISGSTNPYNTYIKTQNAGVYDIQFSAQVEKTDSGTDEIVIWLRKNGTDLTDTATTITLSGNNDKQVAAWNWFVNSAANDYYQIIWYSADTDLRLLAEAAGGGHPGIPSVIVTANRVDQFLSNTGSFSGSFTGQFTGSLFGTSSWASNAVTASNITPAITNSSDNYILTDNGDGTINGEGNLTFDGSLLTVIGELAQGDGSAQATGAASHAEGVETIAQGDYSHAEGYQTVALGRYSHAEGSGSIAIGLVSHAEGSYTTASGDYSHAEGYITIAQGAYSHAEGRDTIASGSYSHAEGKGSIAYGENSHAEGGSTVASGAFSHAEGGSTVASASYSHAEGSSTIAIGLASHAEGGSTVASGSYSHAEGRNAISRGDYSHAEGFDTIAFGTYSHAEGRGTIASGSLSHAEGFGSIASGTGAHAEGNNTIALGPYSHAAGNTTVASGSYQSVIGQFNISSSAQSAFIIGNGTADGSRSNLVFASGSTFQVTGSVIATQGFTGSLFGTSSWAVSASWAPVATTAATASFVTASNVYGPFGSNSIISSSFATNANSASVTDTTTGTGPYYLMFADGTSGNRVVRVDSSTLQFNATTNTLTVPNLAGTASVATTAATASFITGSTNAFIQGGNIGFGTTARLGTIDNESLAFNTNNTTRMFVSSSGNVGIGTTTPYSKFTTLGALSTSTSQMSIVNSEGGHIILRTGISGLTNSGFSIISADVAGTNQNTRLVVSSTGNVGIGTTTPNAKLDISGSALITGSLNVTAGITGSLFGTSSWAVSASWAPVATTAATASFVTSSNVYGPFGSNSIISSSFAQTASFAPLYLPLTGGTITGNVTVNGTASIAFLNVQYESASVIYSSGSNVFGDATNDTQTLNGTVLVSGSQQITGSLRVTQGITGSLLGTASYATQALSASYYGGSVATASYALTASNVQGGTANYIPIWNTATSLSSSAIYQSAGNVGIGTTSPTSKLQSNNASTYNSTTPSGAIIASNLSNGNAVVDIGVDSALLGYIQSRNITSTTSYNLLLNPIGGNVGIGTTTPNYKLHVTGSGTSGSFSANGVLIVSGSNVGIGTATPSSSLHIISSSAALKIQQATGGSIFSGIEFVDYVGGVNASIKSNQSTGEIRYSNAASYFPTFYSNGSEAMRISATGNVGIGTTTPNAKLDVNGNAIITGSLAVSQSLLQYSNITAVTSGSTSNVASFNTSSYTAAFFDYVTTSGTNARAGTVFTVWNGNSVEYAETSTNDIGSTTNLLLSASVTAGAVRLQATSLSGSWSVKTLARMI